MSFPQGSPQPDDARVAAAELGRALVAAVIRYDTQEALALIERGVDLEQTDVEGSTPLVLAAYRCMTEVVGALLAKGADPEAKDRFGITAAQWARSEMSHEDAQKIEKKMEERRAAAEEEKRKYYAWLDAGAPVKPGKVPRLIIRKDKKP